MRTLISELNRRLDELHRKTGSADPCMILLDRLHCHLMGRTPHISTVNGWRKELAKVEQGHGSIVLYMDEGITRICAVYLSEMQTWKAALTSDSSNRAKAIWQALTLNP